MTFESQMKQAVNAVYQGRITGAKDLVSVLTRVFETVDFHQMSTAQLVDTMNRAVDAYELEVRRLMK